MTGKSTFTNENAEVNAPQIKTINGGATFNYGMGDRPLRLDEAARDLKPVFDDVGVGAFRGREWLLADVDRFIRDNPRGYVFIGAEAGMGKTAFAAWLAHRRAYPAHFSYDGGREVRAALQNLSSQLIRAFKVDDLAPDGVMPPEAGTPAGFEKVLRRAADQAQLWGDRLVLVVDGLDEAERHPDGLPFGLPMRLPAGVYIICTYRTGTRLAALRNVPLRWLKIDKGKDNDRDIRGFLEDAARSGLAGQLAEAGMTASRFTDLLSRRCDGVWVYLHYVLEELRLGQRGVETIDELPTGLYGYYADQLSRWEDEDWGGLPGQPGWDDCLPLLATLGVSGEPLPATTLAALAGGELAPGAARRLCEGAFRPLLAAREIGCQPAPELRYEVYHASFREFLTGKLPSPEQVSDEQKALAVRLRADAVTAHSRVADVYLSQFGGLPGLPGLAMAPLVAGADNGYPLRHLANHLRQAGRGGDLHLLLTTPYPVDSERSVNVWFAADDAADYVSGYLDDLARAQCVAAADTGHDLAGLAPAQSLGREIRYALMAASVTSRATSVSDDLLEQVIGSGVWSPARALDHARRVADPDGRCEALLTVRPFLDADQQAGVLAEALAAASTITDHWRRASSLCRLIRLLPDGDRPAVLSQALSAVADIPDPEDRATWLGHVAYLLTPDQMAQALAIATAIDDNFYRVKALTALVPLLSAGDRPTVLAQALDAAAAITHIYVRDGNAERVKALTKIIPLLPDGDRPGPLAQALDTAAATSEYSRARPLGILADILPAELMPRALAAATAITRDNQRGEALKELAPHLPTALVPQALAAAAAITETDNFYRNWALKELARRMPAERMSEGFAALATISDDRERAQALTELAPHMPAGEQPGAWSQALAAVSSVTTDWGRAWALAEIAPLLSAGLVPQAVAVATAITDTPARLQAMTAFVPRLPPADQPGAWAAALAATAAITPDADRATALSRLVPRLPPELTPQALAVVISVSDHQQRARMLVDLVPRLPAGDQPAAWEQAVAAVLAITSDWERERQMRELVPRLPLGDRPAAWERALAAATTATTDNYARARALARLVPRLPAGDQPDAWDQVLAVVSAIPRLGDRATMLTKLASILPSERMSKAVDMATALANDRARARALTALIPHVPATERPGVAARALAAAKSITDEEFRSLWRLGASQHDRVQVLAQLVPVLSPGDRHEVLALALKAAAALTDQPARADALIALAPVLTDDFMPEALSAAAVSVSLDFDGMYRRGALREVARHLPAGLMHYAFDLTDEAARATALHALAERLPTGLMPQALTAAAAINADHERMEALAGLAPHLPDDLLPLALAAATAIADHQDRAIVLTAFIPRLPAGDQAAVVDQALDAATRNDGDGYGSRVRTLARLIPHLPAARQAALWEQAFVAFSENSSNGYGLDALAAYRPAGNQSAFMARVLAAVATVADDSPRGSELARVVPHVPVELLPVALDIAEGIADAGARTEALRALIPRLPVELMPRAQTAVAATDNPGIRTRALTALAAHLPVEQLASALAIAPRTEAEPLLAILARGRELLAQTPGGRDQWVNLLRSAFNGTDRVTCLRLIEAIAPVIAEIGGVGATQDCIDAIADVHQWWP
jgi:hypothetical protein